LDALVADLPAAAAQPSGWLFVISVVRRQLQDDIALPARVVADGPEFGYHELH